MTASNSPFEDTLFSSLKSNTKFLNGILENISSCILLLNKDLKLVAYNDSIRTIFSNKRDEDLLFRRCGEAIGCAATVDEMKDCGTTSKCCHCELRRSGLKTFATGEAIYKKHISKEFYRSSGNKELRHLQFSTRQIPVDTERYVLVIVEDITPLVNQRMEINSLRERIEKQVR